jgi:uncharacterized protein
MKTALAAALGMLFALGLGVSGMTDPSRVLAFLDLGGRWDPSLLWVMAAAVGVYLVSYPLVLHRSAPLLDARFHLPRRRSIDAKLLGGAALFGIGWGIAGLCPGPAVVSLASLEPMPLLFFAALLVGFALARAFSVE